LGTSKSQKLNTVQLNGTCVILKQLEMHPKRTKKSQLIRDIFGYKSLKQSAIIKTKKIPP